MVNVYQLRQMIPKDIFDYQQLTQCLAAYQNPRARIRQLIATDVIIRVKKGLYAFSEPFRKEPVSSTTLANLLFGPSYVSLDYALSFYGMIPERVTTVTSLTICRSRHFSTPFGRFDYHMSTLDRYVNGSTWIEEGNSTCLMATPEKALIDKVWADKRFDGRSLSGFDAYLNEDLRMDQECLINLDLARIRDIANGFRSRKIDNLEKWLHKEARHT